MINSFRYRIDRFFADMSELRHLRVTNVLACSAGTELPASTQKQHSKQPLHEPRGFVLPAYSFFFIFSFSFTLFIPHVLLYPRPLLSPPLFPPLHLTDPFISFISSFLSSSSNTYIFIYFSLPISSFSSSSSFIIFILFPFPHPPFSLSSSSLLLLLLLLASLIPFLSNRVARISGCGRATNAGNLVSGSTSCCSSTFFYLLVPCFPSLPLSS